MDVSIAFRRASSVIVILDRAPKKDRLSLRRLAASLGLPRGLPSASSVYNHVRHGDMLTLTADNGPEFVDADGIRAALRRRGIGAAVYYTHSYAAWEKGSAENSNRLVRRFFPKGADFSRVPRGRIVRLESFINSIHRPVSLGGLTAHEACIEAISAA